jgi:hypothetical protein
MTLERDDDVEWPAAVGDPVALAISQLIAAVIEVTPTDCPERKPRSGAAVEGQADPASDISSMPRPVGLVGRLVAKQTTLNNTVASLSPSGNCKIVALGARTISQSTSPGLLRRLAAHNQ